MIIRWQKLLSEILNDFEKEECFINNAPNVLSE
jgi:hypothetical protein